MPIRGLNKTSDCYADAEKLKKRHEKFLGGIATVRLEKLLRLLQETMKGVSVEKALEVINKDFSIDFDEDMNKLSDRDLKRRKELMDVNFNKNRVRVGDPEFVYDKQVPCSTYTVLLISSGITYSVCHFFFTGRFLQRGQSRVRLGRGRRRSRLLGLNAIDQLLQRVLSEEATNPQRRDEFRPAQTL